MSGGCIKPKIELTASMSRHGVIMVRNQDLDIWKRGLTCFDTERYF